MPTRFQSTYWSKKCTNPMFYSSLTVANVIMSTPHPPPYSRFFLLYILLRLRSLVCFRLWTPLYSLWRAMKRVHNRRQASTWPRWRSCACRISLFCRIRYVNGVRARENKLSIAEQRCDVRWERKCVCVFFLFFLSFSNEFLLSAWIRVVVV